MSGGCNDLPELKALDLMIGAKFCSLNLEWRERNNHRGLILTSSALDDETGTIPGLTMVLEVKRPVVVDRCHYEFGMWQLQRGVMWRAYQLNVSPVDKRTHQDASQTIFGAHEHVGDRASPVSKETIRCGALDVAFEFFCQRINLEFSGQLNAPLL